MSIIHIQDILNKNFKQKSGLAKQITAALVCDEFDKIILEKWGDKVENKAKALYFKDKVLTIACLSSVMAQEIKLHEIEILEQLNAKFEGVVERVRYLV